MHGWASREDGVYATDDGGATWHLVYPRSAVRVARVSASSGMITVGVGLEMRLSAGAAMDCQRRGTSARPGTR